MTTVLSELVRLPADRTGEWDATFEEALALPVGDLLVMDRVTPLSPPRRISSPERSRRAPAPG
ncbi:hypothetical protein [Streptomyces sp. NPDC003032]